MLLALALLLAPSDVVLAGTGTGSDVAIAQNTDLVLGFIPGQTGFALQSIRLFGPSLQGGASITFRLKDAGGTQLAFGGSFLNVDLQPTGLDFSFSGTDLYAYELQNGTNYQLSMYVGGAALLMGQANGNVYSPSGWTQTAGPGVKYSLEAAAVPEPGNFLLAAVAAVFGLGAWWLFQGGSKTVPNC